jgi:transposase InsO family protein
MKQKSDVKVVLKQFLAHAKTLGHNIQELLSDNGGEFDCEEVKRILSENGISQRLTAPYTPEQSGGNERENRTIVEMARTFKYSNSEVEFPDAIWAELVTSAIYILNRTGKSSKDGVSPYELWMGKKPRINLRIIGFSCYVHIPAERRKKMDKKAVKGFLVGYDGDERYRINVPNDHKVILSRDVQFQERME